MSQWRQRWAYTGGWNKLAKIKLASKLYLRLKLWHKQSKDFSPDLLVMQKKEEMLGRVVLRARGFIACRQHRVTEDSAR